MMSGDRTYAILDAARMRHNIDKAKELNTDFQSLYKGQRGDYLAMAAPFLFSCEPESEFAQWLKNEGRGHSWGIFVLAIANYESIYRHFRNFLMVKTENHKQLYFRFYDPRVLRIFLPSCDMEQLKVFFGPIQKFICEDDDPAFALLFSFDGMKLITEKSPADIFFSAAKTINEAEGLPAVDNNRIQQEKKPPRRFFY